jgi:predicted DNA-binding transcriptional regulator AlpA
MGAKIMASREKDHQDRLMTVPELAHFLGVKRSWVYDKTRTAAFTGFPVRRVGKYCRFIREEILDWLERQGD